MSRTPTGSGGTLQQQFKKSAEPFGMCFRIPDSTYVVKKKVGFEMGSKKSLADFFWFIVDGGLKVVLVEAKASAEKRIEFGRLQPHQKDALVDFDGLDRQTYGYIAVNLYDPNNVRNDNRLFMVPVSVWSELESVGDRKSIPLKTLDEREDIIECPRCTGSRWDMEPFVRSLT
jgi:hypothetical protein